MQKKQLIQTSLIVKLLPAIISLFLLTNQTNGQEFKYYTQYMFNGLAINPAYAGSQNSIALTGVSREQWVGMKGAPSTQTISAHAPVMKDQFGLGVIVINDKVGVTNQQEVSVNYSYKIGLPSHDISLGLKMGMNSIRNNYSDLILDANDDMNFSENTSAILPLFGFGAYLKHKEYYAGLSIPHLYKFAAKSSNGMEVEQDRLIFLTGGYLYTINRDLKVRPSALAKTYLGSVFEMDLNANLYYKDDYSIGISYKSLNSVAILFEVGLDKTYYVGYSYDIATTSLITEQNGTHEISVNVYLNRNDRAKIINPRYF